LQLPTSPTILGLPHNLLPNSVPLTVFVSRLPKNLTLFSPSLETMVSLIPNSKGASTSHIINLVSKTPRVLSPSLNNHIVPTYELLYRFLQSHKDTIAVLSYNTILLCDHLVPHNIKMLVQNGVTYPFVMTDKLFLHRYIIRFKEQSSYLLKLYEEKLNLAHTRD